MEIQISLNQKSIQDAIKAVKAYQKEINQKIDTFMKELSLVGIQTALDNSAVTGDSEAPTFSVTSQSGEKSTFVLHMSGKDVAFIEFGAGI